MFTIMQERSRRKSDFRDGSIRQARFRRGDSRQISSSAAACRLGHCSAFVKVNQLATTIIVTAA